MIPTITPLEGVRKVEETSVVIISVVCAPVDQSVNSITQMVWEQRLQTAQWFAETFKMENAAVRPANIYTFLTMKRRYFFALVKYPLSVMVPSHIEQEENQPVQDQVILFAKISWTTSAQEDKVVVIAMSLKRKENSWAMVTMVIPVNVAVILTKDTATTTSWMKMNPYVVEYLISKGRWLTWRPQMRFFWNKMQSIAIR